MSFVKNQLYSKIKSSLLNNKKSFSLPFSWFALEALNVLDKNNFIASFSFETLKQQQKPMLNVLLKTDDNNLKGLKFIKTVSKPSRRIFVNYKTLNYLAQTNTILLLSTSKGLLVSSEALALNLGGEVLYRLK